MGRPGPYVCIPGPPLAMPMHAYHEKLNITISDSGFWFTKFLDFGHQTSFVLAGFVVNIIVFAILFMKVF